MLSNRLCALPEAGKGSNRLLQSRERQTVKPCLPQPPIERLMQPKPSLILRATLAPK